MYRIKRAFEVGAASIEHVMFCGASGRLQEAVDALDAMFIHAWKRHGEGQRPDLDAHQPRTFAVFRCGAFPRMNAEAVAPIAEGVYLSDDLIL